MHRITSRRIPVAALIMVIALIGLASLARATSGAPSPASSTAVPAATGHWLIDPSPSEVRFTITKLGFSNVTGVFRQSDGEIRYDAANPSASSVRWRVRVASVLTDAPNRDRSLQQAEYFNAALHPYLTFVSTSVRRRDAASLEVSGDVTMRGVTRSLTIVVRPHAGKGGPVFETEFQINRYDFGIVGGTVLGRLIGDVADVRLVAVTIPLPAPAAPVPQ